MLRVVAHLHVLVRLVLAVSVGGLIPLTLPHAGPAASVDRTRLAAAGVGHVDHLPALSRIHVRDGGRIDASRRSPHGSVALPVSGAVAPVVGAPAGTAGALTAVRSSAERSSHRLRGPPVRI
jgi:hypothetical protein